MGEQIKAIETVYDGYRFRSRLEARHAVFFNELGIRYQYELEGFNLGNGIRYLPDFYLPGLNLWVEIKGATISEEDQRKVDLFTEQQLNSNHDTRVVILYNIPWTHDGNYMRPDPPNVIYRWNTHTEQIDRLEDVLWTMCPLCGKYDIAIDGLLAHMRCGCLTSIIIKLTKYSVICQGSDDYGFWDFQVHELQQTPHFPSILRAYDVARQARFEHGETPAVSRHVQVSKD